MSIRSGLGRWLFLVTFCCSFVSFGGTPVKSVVFFGDSLSDDGNTTHLLKSLRKEESPAFLVKPVKSYVINRMIAFADYYYVPQMVLDAGISQVTEFFDFQLAPMLADIVGSVRKLPVLPGKPYWQNRFSNGRVWSEYLTGMLGIDVAETEHYTNRAFGGSWAMIYNTQLTVWNFIKHPLLTLKTIINGKLIPPSLGLTVQAYLLENNELDPDTVYFVYAGNNDYINVLLFEQAYDPDILDAYVDNVVTDISESLQKLYLAGARKFVVFGLSHSGNTPKFFYTSDKEILNHAVDTHNDRLQDELERLRADKEDMDLLYFDSELIFERALNEPAKYGFSNTKEACIDVRLPIYGMVAAKSPFKNNFILQYAQLLQHKDKQFLASEVNYHVCHEPEKYLFWDEIHIASRAHHYMAYEVCDAMQRHGYEARCKMPA